jgi:hypothetical protein
MYYKTKQINRCKHLCAARSLVGSVLLTFVVFCVVLFVLFICLRPVTWVPHVASFSELSILYYPFGFL